jgi:hypothetical protein
MSKLMVSNWYSGYIEHLYVRLPTENREFTNRRSGAIGFAQWEVMEFRMLLATETKPASGCRIDKH